MNLSPDNGGPIDFAELEKGLGTDYRRFRIATLVARLKRLKRNHQSTAETEKYLRLARVDQLKWEATL
jgi:hypothetical protein